MPVDHEILNDGDLKRISQIILTYGQDMGKIATALVVSDPSFRKLAYSYRSLSEIADIIVDVFLPGYVVKTG